MYTVVYMLMLTVAITLSPTMVLGEYAKIRILTLWRDGLGPTRIAELLKQYEGIETTFAIFGKVYNVHVDVS